MKDACEFVQKVKVIYNYYALRTFTEIPNKNIYYETDFFVQFQMGFIFCSALWDCPLGEALLLYLRPSF